MSFLIIGLPRHRTAWLANFFTCDGLFCYHEGMDGCKSVDDYRAKLGHNGDSTTGALLLPDVNQFFPERKIIIIEPTKDSYQRCVDFCHQNFGVSDQVKEAYEKLMGIDGMKVKFDEIDSRLGEMWKHVTDKPFSADRANLLSSMQIQTKSVDNYDIESLALLLGSL